jgi:hypothetical protein
VDNAALVQIQRVDDLCDPVGEPEYVRVKRECRRDRPRYCSSRAR